MKALPALLIGAFALTGCAFGHASPVVPAPLDAARTSELTNALAKTWFYADWKSDEPNAAWKPEARSWIISFRGEDVRYFIDGVELPLKGHLDGRNLCTYDSDQKCAFAHDCTPFKCYRAEEWDDHLVLFDYQMSRYFRFGLSAPRQ